MHNDTLAIDPGLTAIGVVVIDRGGDLKHYEVITTSPHLSTIPKTARSRPAFHRAVGGCFSRDPSCSKPPGRPGTPSFRLCIALRGSAVAGHNGAGSRSTPSPAATARKSVTGSGRTPKAEAARILCRTYPDLRIYLQQTRAWKERHFLNIFDALAIALHHQARTNHTGSN